jgi:mannose-6-phosphate isomerase-like protein (cupin superfamily)
MLKMALVAGIFVLSGTLFGQIQPNHSSGGTGASPKETSMVKVFSKDEVAASFAKGGTLSEEVNYKVMTAHRTPSSPAEPVVELHRNFTDIFYIVQGSTTLVTGGKMVGETDKDPDEPRGKSIEGGKTRQLSAGDVVMIPAGVPHLMKDVQGTLLYFVVKVKQ